MSDDIDVDTLVVGGTADALCPAEGVDKLAAVIARSRQAMLAGAGHLMNIERPDEFNELVTAFAT